MKYRFNSLDIDAMSNFVILHLINNWTELDRSRPNMWAATVLSTKQHRVSPIARVGNSPNSATGAC